MEQIRNLIYNDTLNKQMDKFNEYFEETTGYKFDGDFQAIPKDNNWFNLTPENLSVYGDIKDDEIRKKYSIFL